MTGKRVMKILNPWSMTIPSIRYSRGFEHNPEEPVYIN